MRKPLWRASRLGPFDTSDRRASSPAEPGSRFLPAGTWVLRDPRGSQFGDSRSLHSHAHCDLLAAGRRLGLGRLVPREFPSGLLCGGGFNGHFAIPVSFFGRRLRVPFAHPFRGFADPFERRDALAGDRFRVVPGVPRRRR